MVTNTKKPQKPSGPAESRSHENSGKRSAGISQILEKSGADPEVTEIELKSRGAPELTPTLSQEELQL